MNQKYHYYMGTVLITYEREGSIKQKHLNLTLELPSKKINFTAMDRLRQSSFKQLQDLFQVNPEKDIRDYTLVNIMYLGLMTQDDFYGEDDRKAEKAAQTAMLKAQKKEAEKDGQIN